MRWGLLGLALLASGCGKPASGPGAAPPGQCVAPAGPLIAFTREAGSAANPRGGAIVDGVYDLQRLVKYRPGPGTSKDDAPLFRATMSITTQERSSNHTEGVIATNIEIAPQTQCFTGRYVATGNTIRSSTDNVLFGAASETMRFDAMGDTLVVVARGGGNATESWYDAYFFKRR